MQPIDSHYVSCSSKLSFGDEVAEGWYAGGVCAGVGGRRHAEPDEGVFGPVVPGTRPHTATRGPGSSLPSLAAPPFRILGPIP